LSIAFGICINTIFNIFFHNNNNEKFCLPLAQDLGASIIHSFPQLPGSLIPPSQEGSVHGEDVQRQAMEMQRSILDAIPAHLAVLDRSGSIIFINESWRRFLGRPKGSCEYVEMGQNYIEYCELADHAFDGMGPQVAAGIRKVMQVGDAAPYSLTHPVHREEKSKWYRVTATSLGRSDVIGAVVMYQDVTEQHLAEEEIRAQAMLLDQAEDAIFVQDLQGRILYWNNCATRLHGWEAIEVRGRRTEDFLSGIAW
jgi:PAS domain-containing protein